MSVKYFFILLLINFLINGCFNPFKKQPNPEPAFEPVIIMAPTSSIKWEKIQPIYSNKTQINDLLGVPDFIDKHQAGEDWYYSYERSVDYAVISFPVSGYHVDHVQHIRYPEWK